MLDGVRFSVFRFPRQTSRGKVLETLKGHGVPSATDLQGHSEFLGFTLDEHRHLWRASFAKTNTSFFCLDFAQNARAFRVR